MVKKKTKKKKLFFQNNKIIYLYRPHPFCGALNQPGFKHDKARIRPSTVDRRRRLPTMRIRAQQSSSSVRGTRRFFLGGSREHRSTVLYTLGKMIRTHRRLVDLDNG